MAEAPVLIVSKDMDFAQSLAEQVQNELSVTCHIASTREAAKPHLSSASMVVLTGDAPEEYSCPVLSVKDVPVKMRDLLEQIAAIRLKQSADDMILGKGYVLQLRQKQLLHMPTGGNVVLTDKETQIIQCLGEVVGRVVTKESLLKTVWGIDSELDTHTLETHIYRLRNKIRELSGQEALISATPGGYAIVLK